MPVKYGSSQSPSSRWFSASQAAARVAALDGPLEPLAVEKVDALVAHLGALLAQLARDVASDEARRP